MKHWFFLLPIVMFLLLAGCSTSSMKGTPFYTGEYAVREGPAADRVNLWPLAYYRNPALSVLWPIMEFSPEQLAVRPVYSVYDRNTEHPVYNVLWPVGRFAAAEDKNRIFPVCWGANHLNIVPLYWHKGESPADGGHDILFPIWRWEWDGDGYSREVLWPFYTNRKTSRSQSWSLWPLYGTAKCPARNYRDRYYAWPFIHFYTEADKSGHEVLPVYAYEKEPDRTCFISLPYSREITTKPGGKSWELALPLWYREWVGDDSKWTLFPALSGGKKTGCLSDNWYAAGLAYNSVSNEARKSHLIPFYLYRQNPESTELYSLPWSTVANKDGSGWSAAFPFYFSSRSSLGSVLMTPLYARKLSPDGAMSWQCFVPFVYLDETKDKHFMTPLGGRWRMGDKNYWLCLPLLSKSSSDAESGRTVWLAGLGGHTWNDQNASHYAFPFYYTSQSNTVRKTGVPLLLSDRRTTDDKQDTTLFGGLAGWKSTSGKAQSSYVFPVYGWKKDDHFCTALVGREQNFSYYLTPLVGRYTGKLSGSRIQPFYGYQKTKTGAVDISYLLLGEYEKDEYSKGYGFAPLFNYNKREYIIVNKQKVQAESKCLRYLLLGKYEKDDYSKEYGFAPLFKYGQRDYTVDHEQKVQAESKHLKYLLLGNYEKSGFNKEYGFLPFFYYNQKSCSGGDKQSPVQTESKHLRYLLIGKNAEIRNSAGSADGQTNVPVSCKKSSSLFPVWSHETNEDFLPGKRYEKSAWLSFLYDTLHEEESGEKKNDYFRRRVLWRLYHKESLNGDSSTDIFPAITIDSRQNGYFKCSVLWRLFRYEKDAEGGGRKLDVLFIPIRR